MSAFSLDRLAETRWQAVVDSHPELTEAVALQRQLVGGMLRILDVLAREGEPAWTLAEDRLDAKLAQGVPALREEAIPVPVELLRAELLSFCDCLSAGGAGDAARHVRHELETRRIDAGSLLTASLARNESAIRLGAQQMGLAPDLVWLLGELTVGPVAARLAGTHFGLPDGFTRDAWRDWARGYCPTCGSWPALIDVCAGTRRPRCSFCGTAWTPPYRCVYCGEDGDAFATAVPDPERPGRRLELCARCGGYVKTLDAPDGVPFPLTAIDDLGSTDLDLAAMERGHRRVGLAAIPSFREAPAP